MAPSTKEAQRAEPHKTIWRIANDLRGSVDGWDFKTFSSPSTAAAVALSRSSNGRIEWRSPEGGTYGDWENRGVE